MAARKIFRDTSSPRDSNTRPRDSVIDELPPEETEKMGYVWVVKGTLTDEEERVAAQFKSMLDISSLPQHEISSCNLAKEKVQELIEAQNDGQAQSDSRNLSTVEDFRLYMPSFIRQMHSLMSRPPEIIRKDTIALQEILRHMPKSLFDRPSYIQHLSRYLELDPRQMTTVVPEKEDVEVSAATEESVKSEKEEQDAASTEPEKESEEELPGRKSKEEEQVDLMKDRDLNAVYADPEIDSKEPPNLQKPSLPAILDLARQRRKWEQGEPSSRGRSSEKQPFIRDYILRKVEDLENKLKRVNNEISNSMDRKDQLKYHVYEMEILKLVEKISKADTPSETDIAKLEYLTDLLKIAQGKKTAEE